MKPTSVHIDQAGKLEGVAEPPRELYPGDVLVHKGKRYRVLYIRAWHPEDADVERHVTVVEAPDELGPTDDGWHLVTQ